MTLTIGTGATTIMFTVINGVLLKPLPYAEPDRLAAVQGHAERPRCWVTVATMVSLLVIAALCASYAPAHRASRVDPVRALPQSRWLALGQELRPFVSPLASGSAP